MLFAICDVFFLQVHMANVLLEMYEVVICARVSLTSDVFIAKEGRYTSRYISDVCKQSIYLYEFRHYIHICLHILHIKFWARVALSLSLSLSLSPSISIYNKYICVCV